MEAGSTLMEFSDELLQLEIQKFENLNIEPMFTVIDNRYEYQGFQPKEHLKALLIKKKTSNVTDDIFQSDMVKMIAMFIKIGNPNPNNLKKRAPEVSSDVDMMKLRYGLSVSAQGKPSSTITIPRVAATFATLTMRVAHRIGVRDYTGPLGSNMLPWFMKVPVFPAIIPHEFPQSLKEMLLNAFMAFSVEQSLALSRRKPDEMKVIFYEQKNIIMSIHATPIPSAKDRTNFARTLDWRLALKPVMDISKVLLTKIPEIGETPATRMLKPLLIQQGYNMSPDPATEPTTEPSGSGGGVRTGEPKGKEPAIYSDEDDDEEDQISESEDVEQEFSIPNFPPVMHYPKGANKKSRAKFRAELTARGFTGRFDRAPE